MNSIKVGFPISITGRYSIQGRESLEGLLLWHSIINSLDGLYIRSYEKYVPVELIYYDDESRESICTEIISRLITKDKVDILIGPYSSGLSIAVAPITKKLGITVWNYGGATDEITEHGYSNFINAITPSSNYYLGLIDLFNEKLSNSHKKLVIVYAENSGFSNNVKNGARIYALSKNFEVNEFSYMSGKSDFSDIVNNIHKSSPDLILGVGRTEDDINFARSIIQSGNIDTGKVALVAASINYFKDILGEDAEGFLSTSQWEKDLSIKPEFGPTPMEFYSNFLNFYKKEPNYLAAQAFNIGLIIEKCINLSGNINNDLLYKEALGLDIKTFYGRFKIDKNTGIQIGHKMLVTSWQNGCKVLLQ